MELKRTIAASLSAALSRPIAAPSPTDAGRVLLVRIDRRVGEALLMTPLLCALKARRPQTRVELLVHPSIARVLDGHPAIDRLIQYGPWALRTLRRERYPAVVDCTNWTAPSTTSAIVARLCAPQGAVIGPVGAGLERLRDISVPPLPGTRREVLQRLNLLSPLGGVPMELQSLSFRPRRGVRSAVARMADDIRRLGGRALVNPGGRLGARRLPPAAFCAASRALADAGRRPIITWGPGERALAEEVQAGCAASELAPPTTVDELAELMEACQLTVCNNTGPMHLSVAVGAPTLGLFVAMDMERWGHPQAPHRMVDLTAAMSAGGDVVGEVANLTAQFAAGVPKAQRPAAGSGPSGLASSTSITGTSSSIA